MKNLIDLHTHSVSCSHAYSTVKENYDMAKDSGLFVYGLSEHGYAMDAGVKKTFFKNLLVIEEDRPLFLRGIEANFVDFDGNIGEEEVLPYLDYCIASMHIKVLKPGSRKENTRTILKALNNEKINIIGHLDDSRYPVDYKDIVNELSNSKAIIELNNSSLSPHSFRIGARDNLRELLPLLAKAGQKIIINTDAHYYKSVGDIRLAIELLEELDFPKDLVINFNEDLLKDFLENGMNKSFKL